MADDFDLDLSDDFDFDSELASISGGTSYSEPPKNAREAAMRTLKDTKSGFIGAVKGDNVRELAKNVIEDSIPDKIRNEYDTVKSAYEEVTGTVREELDGVKKESKKAVDAITKLIPGDNKINKFLKSISEKLGDNETRTRELSKEQEQQNAINEAIIASLGEQKTIAQQNEALAQTMEEKRHISTTELLKNIYAELKMGRNFQFEVANNYYRKSLEIQFKQLYTAQEQLGVIKSGFETFKNQFESIVKNTGLPEIVKIKQSEQVIKSIGDRYREELANTFYKDFDPFRNMKDRWVKSIKDFSNNLKEGLSGGADVVNMMADMSDPEMGMSKGYTIGNFLGNAVRKKLVQKVSNKLYDTEKGKRATMALKDLVQDPDGYLKGVIENEEGTGFFSKMKKSAAKTLRGFTNVNASQNTAVFDQDINAAAIFDNRTKDSIVKVIPTLLAKIHAEIKSLRMKDKDPSQHELSFNYKTQEFQTKDVMISSIKDDMNSRIKNNIGYSLKSLEDMLVTKGKMNRTLAKEFKSNLIKYLYNPKSRINVDALASKDFLTLFDKRFHKALKNAVFHLKKAFQEDHDLHDTFNMTMKSIKAGLPNTNNIAKELISSGRLDIAKDLGFVKHDTFSGSIVSNNAKMGDITADLYGKLDGIDMHESVIDTITKNNDNLLKSKVESVKSRFSSAKDKVKSLFGFGKKYYNEKVDKYVKEYYQKANEYSKPFIDKMSQELSEQIDKLKETEAYKKADEKVKELMESDEAKKVIEKYRKANTIIDNIDKKHNISQKAKWLKDLTKSKITGLYNNNNGEREDLLNTIKDKVQYDQYGKPVVEGLQEGLQDMKKDAVDFLNDKQTASGLFSKYKSKVTNLFKRGKEVATSDKAKEIYTKAVDKGKATIEKGKMTFDKIKDPVKRKELMQELKEDFLKAKQYSETKANDFKEYLEEIGFDLGSNPEETISKILTAEDKGSIFTRLKNKFNKFKQKTMENQIENLEEKLDNAESVVEIVGQDKEQTEALKKEFFESPEYKSGAVTDFEQWCSALGYKIKKTKAVKTAKGLYKAAKAGYKFMNSDFFKKTRALDRKIFMSIPKALGSVLKVGGKLGLKAGKIGGQALATSVGALTSIGMNTADSISAVLLSKVSNTLDRIADKDAPNKTKERANSWKDRIKLFSRDKYKSGKGDKKKGFMAGVANFVKEHPTMSLGLGITAMVGLLRALNISMDDVKDFASGIWKGIKFIGNTISSIWNFIKHPIDGVKNLASNAWDGVKSMFGFKDDKNKSEKENNTDSKDESDGISGGEIAGVGAATLGAAYVGKKVYNVGKMVASPFISAGKFAAEGATLGAKAMGYALKPNVPGKESFLTKFRTLIMKSIEKISWALPSGLVETMKSKATGALNYVKKVMPSWDAMKNGFDKLVKVVKRKSPATATKALTKLSAKLAAYFGSAATGVGVILTVGLALWDIGWIIKYWLSDGMSFWGAVAKQVLGIEITDEDMEATDKDIKSVQQLTSGNKLYFWGDKGFYYRRPDGSTVTISNSVAREMFSVSEINAAINEYKKEQERITVHKTANNLSYNNGSGTRKPINNVNYNTTTTNSTPNITGRNTPNKEGLAKKVDERSKINSSIPKPTASASMQGSVQAAQAAAIASERAAPKSTGKCAMRVRQALEASGYQEPPGRPGSAYQYATTGFISKYGFERLNVDPISYKPQTGDISITDRFNNHQHGHIAIYDGKNWISDFKQKSINIYSDLPRSNAKNLISIWRHPGYGTPSSDEASLNGSQDLTLSEELKIKDTPKAKYANLEITPNSKSTSTPSTTSVASYSSSKSSTSKTSNTEIASKSPTISMTETNKILSKQLEVQVKQLEVQMNMDQTLTQLLNNSHNFDPSKLMPMEDKPMPKPAIGIQRNIAV